MFIENKKEVEKHNRSKSSFWKKVNFFARLSDEEFMSRYTPNQSTKKAIENVTNRLKGIYKLLSICSNEMIIHQLKRKNNLKIKSKL